MDGLDLYLSRRKETQNWLLLALGTGVAIAVAARVPLLVVSLPLTWIAGGFSIAFLWVAGPPVMWFFHAIAFNALVESEGARKFALGAARKQSISCLDGTDDPDGITIVDEASAELRPVLSGNPPLAIILLHGTFWLAPVIVSCILLGSYLQFVRPGTSTKWAYSSRWGQEADALVGVGGWGWLRPLAPSLQGNIDDLLKDAKGNDTIDKYKALQKQIPYVFFPIQTWLYIAGILFGVDVAFRALQMECGADAPRSLITLAALARSRLHR